MGAVYWVCDGDAGGHSLHCFRIVRDGVFRHHAGNGLFDPDRGADAGFDDTAVDHAQYAGGAADGAGELPERRHRHGSYQVAYDPHDPAAFGHAWYREGYPFGGGAYRGGIGGAAFYGGERLFPAGLRRRIYP